MPTVFVFGLWTAAITCSPPRLKFASGCDVLLGSRSAGEGFEPSQLPGNSSSSRSLALRDRVVAGDATTEDDEWQEEGVWPKEATY